MIIYPAIDIRHGRCVRLRQGRAEAETVFAEDPLEVAHRWVEEGAEWLHIVDLDGAFEGSSRNLPIVRRIVREVPIPVQLGGGIRTAEAVARILDLGVTRVILGTVALKAPSLLAELVSQYDDHIVVGIDARDGMVATEGWLEMSERPAVAFAQEMTQMGVRTIIYTDIQRDGMLTGPNLPAIRQFVASINAEVIAAGGIATLDDIRALKQYEPLGLGGVVTGKALYTGHLSLREAIQIARSLATQTETKGL